MADGQQNRVAFVIQARMQSSRLPGKILLSIPFENGKPLLQWIVDELRKSTYDADIIVATSEKQENDVLERFCKTHGLKCFRGDEEHVLSRFVGIAKENDYTTLVRLTADNPILDIAILDDTIACHLENDNHYTNTTSLPIGMNFEVIASNALLGLDDMQLTGAEKEHVTLLFKNNDRYKKMTFTPDPEHDLDKIRLTVDYPSDLLVVSAVLSFYNEVQGNVGIRLVEDVYRRLPFVFEVNESNFQKRQFAKPEEEITFAGDLLRRMDLDYSAGILDKYEKKDII